MNIFQDSVSSNNLDNGAKLITTSLSDQHDELSKLDAYAQGEKLALPPLRPKPSKGNKKSRNTVRSANLEATKYIEHLEHELSSLNAKLESLTSPSTTKGQAAKIRSLTKQVQSLRQEVLDWEERFEERVVDEVYKRTEIEAELNSKVRALEEELAAKVSSIRELELEVEEERNRIKETESVEVSLGRRVDVLTELLAQSPTRLDTKRLTSLASSSSTTPNPVRFSRPSLPRCPTSPLLRRYSNTLSADGTSLSDDRRASSSIQEYPEDEEQPDPDSFDRSMPCLTRSGSTRSTSDAMDSYRPVPSSSSRPTSFVSTSSFGTSWAGSFPNDDVRTSNRPKKMRRFGAGSTTLKPLILPTAAALPQSLPASAPAQPNFRDSFADFPRSSSTVPATAFRSEIMDDAFSDTPTRPNRHRPASWAQTQDSDLFDGKPSWLTGLGESHHRQDPGEGDGLEAGSKALSEPSMQAYSLGNELEQVDDPTFLSPDQYLGDPASREETPDVQSLALTAPRANLDAIVMGQSSMQRTLTVKSCPRRRSLTPQEIAHTSAHQKAFWVDSPARSGSSRSGSLLGFTASMIGRISDLIALLKREPFVLARRILARSWAGGSARLGGVGWWLLGLVFGARERKEGASADGGSAGEKQRGSLSKGHLVRDLIEQTPTPVRSGSREVDAESTPVDHPRQRNHGDARPSTNEGIRAPARSVRSACGSAAASIEHGSENTRMGLASLLHSHLESDSTIERREAKPPTEDRGQFDGVKPESKHGLKLWCKFSLALILAIGIAVIEGPGTLLAEPHQEDGGDVAIDSKRDDGAASTGRRLKCRWRGPHHDEKRFVAADAERQRGPQPGEARWTLQYPFVDDLMINDFEAPS